MRPSASEALVCSNCLTIFASRSLDMRVPWAKFSLNTSVPASKSSLRESTSLVDGPSVDTCFVNVGKLPTGVSTGANAGVAATCNAWEKKVASKTVITVNDAFLRQARFPATAFEPP
ncbi:aconitase C-terminal domain-containing protein, putative [Babesia ovata]|uniref:Aconitase C-terminal domain-containing protein, putative n=1 Tax=Babesia ovata TaxID=189622 RepID=A0A2H6KEW9_9APIC|nr:aconitase C-terminal domain-containing protein, putative [Babesia ovata]GBE61524.1 aconitase C-terminal domain-containing protein, putative [Babesia ovata]